MTRDAVLLVRNTIFEGAQEGEALKIRRASSGIVLHSVHAGSNFNCTVSHTVFFLMLYSTGHGR